MGSVSHPEEQGPIHALDHVEVEVRDLDTAVSQWTTFLGREVDDRFVEIDGPGRGARVQLERGAVELREAEGEGLSRLVFACEDLGATAEELTRRGLSVEEESACRFRGRDGREWREGRRRVGGEKDRGEFVCVVERPIDDSGNPPKADAARWLDHVVVNTGDPEAAKRFYGDGLGLRLPLDRAFPQWGARMLFFRTAGVTVEVTASLDEPLKGPDRLWGLAYRVDDPTAFRERLLSRGIHASELRPGRKAGTQVFHSHGGPSGIPTLVLGRPDSNILSS